MKKLKFLPLAAIVTLIVYSLGFTIYEQVLTWDPVTIQFFQYKRLLSFAKFGLLLLKSCLHCSKPLHI